MATGESRLAELRTSARGWHGVQLAVLGFIGLCGVLQQDAGQDKPGWLRVAAGLLVLVAFGTACVATVLVALAAWPVYTAEPRPDDVTRDAVGTGRRLRAGITLTFVAVAVLALAASSAWWPSGVSGAAAAAVEVGTRAGVVCGDLQESPREGVLVVAVGGQSVEVRLADVVSLRPVDACG